VNASPSKSSTAPIWKRFQNWLRDSFVAGLIASVPIIVVWFVVYKLVLGLPGVLELLPAEWRAATWTPPWADLAIPVLKTPGLDLTLSLGLIVLVGWIARSFVGRRIVAKVTDAVQQVPVVGTLYSAVRQLLEAVFSSQAQHFQRVVMVQFPREGCYVLGFVTARAWPGAEEAVGCPLVSVFVPTTPNPTSGFFTMFPEDEVLALDMTVEEAFKALMSSGIVQPEHGGLLLGADVGTMTVDVEPAE